ncbi:putative nuclear pore protein [Daldinia childiae]|uniref:putative nuclear pore protein n=1 Tax=Daldinia childiae TaxID=326645 RepID=UPI001447FE34|nr:putative nuclear pore protein [Daldinia childiae]KAF3065182.1 putative nuclear pore protein [Daldinia childiae]
MTSILETPLDDTSVDVRLNPCDDVTSISTEIDASELAVSPSKTDKIATVLATTGDDTTVLSDGVSADQFKATDSSASSVVSIQEPHHWEEQSLMDSSSSNMAKSIIYFDIDSDLDIPLYTQRGPTVCKVSSAHLALASPVWRTMLYGNDAVKRSDVEDWVVSIEGDASALITLFCIIHYEFNKIPTTMSPDELHSIAVAINQYKCAHLVYPWVEMWVNRLPEYDTTKEYHRNSRKTVFIAWVLGDISLFRCSVEQIVLSSKLIDGQLVDADGKSLSDMKDIHKDLSGWIRTARFEIISQMLDALKEPFKRPTSADGSCEPPFCKLGSQQKECETMMLGSIILQLVAAKLFPAPEAHEFTDSIETLQSKIKAIKYTPYEGRDWMPHLSHVGCSLGYSEAAEESVANMRIPLDHGFMSGFFTRARVSGVKKSLEFDECFHEMYAM